MIDTHIQFSVDDAIGILKELTEKQPQSLFEIERFAFFRGLRQEYGITVSFYAFFEEESGFTLFDVTDKYKKEFEENADWLKFGVHSTNRSSSFSQTDGLTEYERIYQALIRIAGEKSMDLCFRPHFFAIDSNLLRELKRRSLAVGVHCPDDERKCHTFSPQEKERLNKKGYLVKEDIVYVKTQTRIENLTDETFLRFLQSLKGKEVLSLFTHECFLENEEIRDRIKGVCQFAKEKAFCWSFPMDIRKIVEQGL